MYIKELYRFYEMDYLDYQIFLRPQHLPICSYQAFWLPRLLAYSLPPVFDPKNRGQTVGKKRDFSEVLK